LYKLFKRDDARVPDEFITYMKSLVANPIEFYSCFISYSTKDQEFAERLHGDLRRKMKRDFSLRRPTGSSRKKREGWRRVRRSEGERKNRPAPFEMTVGWSGCNREGMAVR
jgi:hypothetical protein